MPYTEIMLLCIAAFAAGFVDAIVGGGGLIQTPAILILLPQYPVATLLGTVKIPSFTGTSLAAYQYAKRVDINRPLLLRIALIAFIGSFLGSYFVSVVSNQFLKPIILCLLIAVAIYTFFKKDFGTADARTVAPQPALIYGITSGFLLGFYDGFFGPGMGSFMILVFIGLLGNDFLHASANAKMVNLATNLGSIIYFSSTGHILYEIALPMAAFNMLGSFFGTRLALKRGNGFVRIFFFLVVCATILRFAYDLFIKN
jgi:uncharacterized protein